MGNTVMVEVRVVSGLNGLLHIEYMVAGIGDMVGRFGFGLD